jgi:hypothetical protein
MDLDAPASSGLWWKIALGAAIVIVVGAAVWLA